MMQIARIVGAVPLAFVCFAATAQEESQGPPDLGALRRLRSLESVETAERPAAPQAPLSTEAAPRAKGWTLTPEIAGVSKGTFGIDLSHYETNNCNIDWRKLAGIGLRYVYLELTQGNTSYASVIRSWKQLDQLHRSSQLFRGAYHFLLPNEDLGTDATSQANVFLAATGAVGGTKVAELPPIIDIEPTKTPVKEASGEFTDCKRLSSDGNPPKYYCDMWYKMKPKGIVTLALNWIKSVKQATGQDVIVYSSPGAWAQVVGSDGQALAKDRAIWIARYSSDGSPGKDPRWFGDTWNSAWSMPKLFGGASYPSPIYNVPDFWQFSETGRLSENPITCSGMTDSFDGALDLNFIPVRDAQFKAVFGIP
jgi:GH25 family lysozyme M1 (1,4-beta-N-acetylmuramidase)